MLSHIVAEEEDNVPDAPNKVRCDQAKWKEIGGLALCDENCKLVVLDSGFCSIRVIANVGQLWRRPKTVLHIMRLTIHGNDFNFSPFATSMCRPHSRRALITDPKNGCICLTEVSGDFTVLSIIRKIVTDEIERPICCLQLTPDALIVTCVSHHFTSDGTGVKFLTVDDEIKVEYSIHNTDFSIGFPFGICEDTNGICVADYAKHCVYHLDIANETFRPVIGSYDTEGQEDGPSDKAILSHPACIASRGDAIYIVEHPPNYQGAIRMYYSLVGLINFQSSWNSIASSVGLVSRRMVRQNQAVAREIKTKVPEDALPGLRVPCGHLQDIVDSCKNRTSASALDITHCSMASKTAEAVFITLIKGMEFLIDYLKHIRHEELLRHIIVKMLNDSLAEAFFGHITEMISGNNLTFLQMARLLASGAFHYSLIVLSSSDNLGVTVRRTRDEHAGTYFYNSIDDCSGENAKSLLWLFFNARHESLFTTEQLRRAKKNNHNS